MPVFSPALHPEEAEAVLHALELEVESCIKADIRDRQSFGFGPVIHEDSARDRAYLSVRKQAALSALQALKVSGVPYAAEALERARGAEVRLWGAFQREQEEKALQAKLDQDPVLREALRVFSFSLAQVTVRKSAKAHPYFASLGAETDSVLRKANAKTPGWAARIGDLGSQAQNIAHTLPESSAATVYKLGRDLEEDYTNARRCAREAKAVA